MNYFFCTKPLQYYNCVNIVNELVRNGITDNILFIIPNFHNADEFCSRVEQFDKMWKEVRLVASKIDPLLNDYKVNKSDNVYVHSDLHWELSFNGDFGRCSVFVYEEGLGAYEKFITKITNSKIKNAIIYFLSVVKILNSTPGNHPKTKKQFLYNKEKYDKVHPKLIGKSELFPSSFFDNYSKNKNIFDKVFCLESISFPKEHKICLFLTSNNRDVDFRGDFENIKKNFSFSIFKAHPNVADLFEEYSSEYSDILAELLIMKLIDNNNDVDIYHYGTTVEANVVSDRVNFINLSL